MTEHTPGPLSVRHHGDANHHFILQSNGHWLMVLKQNGEISSVEQDANARRLVACWNACEGIPTEALEAHGIGCFAAFAHFKKQKDDMLETLALAYNALRLVDEIAFKADGGISVMVAQARDKARALITKEVKGGS